MIGSPGAGKSVFSRELSRVTGIPLYHLDNIYWHEDRTHITREELILKLTSIMSGDEWIIDGNYTGTMEMRIQAADTVFFLDLPADICLEGVKARIGKKRDDIPWTEETPDDEFIRFVRSFRDETRPRIEALLAAYPDKRIYRFESRCDMRIFMETIV